MKITLDMDTFARLGLIAERDNVSLETLIPNVFEKGISLFEHSQAASRQTISARGPKKLQMQQRADFIAAHYQTMSDEEMAKELGLNTSTVRVTRLRFGFLRPASKNKKRGPKVKDISALGTKEDIVRSLTRGGKHLPDLFRDAHIRVTPQRMAQILQSRFQLKSSDLEREPEWYVRRMKLSEPATALLIDKAAVEERLREITLTAFAAEVGGVTYTRLAKYLKDILRVDPVLVVPEKTKVVELICANPECPLPEHKFYRSGASVRGDKKHHPEKNNYCSRECFGQAMGKTVGFAAHSENIPKGGRKKHNKSEL